MHADDNDVLIASCRTAEDVNRLIAEFAGIDHEALTSPLALVLTTARSRAFDADVGGGDEGGGGGDGKGMGENVQCKVKDVFVAQR